MKAIITTLILGLTGTLAYSQTAAVSGTVNNQNGQPVPYALVRDVQHSYATYADSAGTFFLKADPSSALEVSAVNYKSTQVKIDTKANLNVVLPLDGAQGGAVAVTPVRDQINGEFLKARDKFTDGSQQQVKAGFVQEPTHGSRYLYADWLPGFGITGKDSLVAEIANMYNFDKIAGNIMYTKDGRAMLAVPASQVRSFSLFDKKGRAHVYENMPAVSDKPFVEVLLNTPKYKIYKKIDTKLIRADFHTDGVIEMGHRYDEYVDNEHYYFVGADGKPQSISLKKSTLKKLLGGEADSFIAAQGSRDVDEDYVKDLGISMSK
ncbi:MAG TPA: carboxypeptidase-like regulatory domain-containing protein [Mucilaginibacter sp.]